VKRKEAKISTGKTTDEQKEKPPKIQGTPRERWVGSGIRKWRGK